MNIKISIVVPTHNTGYALLEGLNSFRRQTMPREEFEVIYVDDGSTDDTVSILTAELAGETNFHLIRGEHSSGPGRPRNIGIDNARGTYIHFVDEEDWLTPQALERLFRRAEERHADVVAGRMAGHGRSVPRVLFTKPMTDADIRRDTILLSSLSVHKLFRTNFLNSYGLRFPEGPVPLADHMFMVRAYLLTSAITTVHDYTCYHWVRGAVEQQTALPSEQEVAAHLGSVKTIIDVLGEYVDPGPVRNKLIAHWYASQVLGRLLGNTFLDAPDAYQEMLLHTIGQLLARAVPAEVDDHLTPVRRVASAIARYGNLRHVREFAQIEQGTTHEPRLEGLEWHGDELVVRVSSVLTTLAPSGASEPVTFNRTGGLYRWQLPPHVASVPGVTDAVDFTEDLVGSRVRGVVRHREEGSEILTPTVQRIVDEAVPSETEANLCSIRFESYFTVNTENGNQGSALTGVWDAYLRLDTCGWTTTRRLGAHRTAHVEKQRRPAFTGQRRAFVNPYWTTPHANLSLSVNGRLDPLNRAVRSPGQIWVLTTGEHVDVEIPVTLAPIAEEVPVVLRLEAPGRDPLRLPAAIRSAHGPGVPVLALSPLERQLRTHLGGASWDLHVEREGRSGRLGLTMRQEQSTGMWFVTR